MSSVNIVNRRRLTIFRKDQIDLSVTKLLRTLKKRPEKKRFLLVEYGEPLDDRINPQHAVLKLTNFTYNEEGDLTALVYPADTGRPSITLGGCAKRVSLGQLLLSSRVPTFEFKFKRVRRPVLKDEQPVYDELGRQQFFYNCCLYTVPIEKPILSEGQN
ncbi:hypothetical protein FDJ25_gp069 [Vibrio phage Aphrodite1]|uniref:Uncharacterized protein n=1 Tax=Vibrio phage Aphrodite1 TaxID=2070057 RepID=A0A2I7QI32_9CAUD|nr:hypothetical protein FDJ25_gp069 [Vibrio phage Aphrodite1]AUR81052.1 hypothetical protein Aphrodite1_0134 [Vibrio phage Aphrodite1]